MARKLFEWVIAPEDQLIPNIRKYGERALVVIQAVGNYWGQQIQDDARRRVGSEHLWIPRTGAAQGGLFFAMDGFGMEPITGTVTPEAEKAGFGGDMTIEQGDDKTLIICLGHTVYYGKFLELSNGGEACCSCFHHSTESSRPGEDAEGSLQLMR